MHVVLSHDLRASRGVQIKVKAATQLASASKVSNNLVRARRTTRIRTWWLICLGQDHRNKSNLEPQNFEFLKNSKFFGTGK